MIRYNSCMARHHVTLLLITIGTVLTFAITLERMQIPVPTTTELRSAYQYGTWLDKPTPPRSFVFDGCTLFPDNVFGSSFRQACLQHDIAYWYGGSAAERLAADRSLRTQVAAAGAWGTVLQYPMYWSVRVFGASVLLRPINANWGFGYNTDS